MRISRDKKDIPVDDSSLEARLERLEDELHKIAINTRQPPLKLLFVRGLVTGLGTVLGATVLVSLLVAIFQPLKHVQAFGPEIERLTNALEKQHR